VNVFRLLFGQLKNLQNCNKPKQERFADENDENSEQQTPLTPQIPRTPRSSRTSKTEVLCRKETRNSLEEIGKTLIREGSIRKIISSRKIPRHHVEMESTLVPPQRKSGDFSVVPPEKFYENGNLLKSFKVGYHRNIQVTSGQESDVVVGKLIRTINKQQIVSQVLCTALNMAFGKSGKANAKADQITEKCKFILKAAYYGAYLTAIANNHKQLFLTIIGAGNFGNKLEWIYEAILEAHVQWGNHKNCNLEAVKLIIDTNEYYRPFFVNLEAKNIDYKLVEMDRGKQ